MQGLPYNGGTEGSLYNPNGFGTAYARGATTINPRGLGAQRFLVLINGRRAVPYGAPDSTGAYVFDFDSIPVDAVESVDYLKDGASAIYGSDAITGVVNIRLKRNYSGVSTEFLRMATLPAARRAGWRSIRGQRGSSWLEAQRARHPTW